MKSVTPTFAAPLSLGINTKTGCLSASRSTTKVCLAPHPSDSAQRRRARRASAVVAAQSQNTVPSDLKVLVVGSGGREHALVKKIASSPRCSWVAAAPGSYGIASDANEVNPDVGAEDVEALVSLAVERRFDLVVVGPEVPLVKGLVDRLQEKGILAFGPTAAAAILEGSKVFMKDFLKRHDIPSAWYESFSDVASANKFIDQKGAPIVIKADGLAAGKGVILAQTVDEAKQATKRILEEGEFGNAGATVVIEEFLVGEEVSFFAVLDGKSAVPLASAQDHKAAYDGDTGPNTGGMGSYSPAPVCDTALAQTLMDTVVYPTARGMESEGRSFSGVLYCGIMVTKEGPKVLEFNVRFGDPECQVLCERMQGDLLELMYQSATGNLSDAALPEWDDLSSVVVVLASEGYPGTYSKGSVIRNIGAANEVPGVYVYHAGTSMNKDSEFISSGGRVLGVTASGSSITDAQATAYRAVDLIDWPQGFCRRDIGWRAIAREKSND